MGKVDHLSRAVNIICQDGPTRGLFLSIITRPKSTNGPSLPRNGSSWPRDSKDSLAHQWAATTMWRILLTRKSKKYVS